MTEAHDAVFDIERDNLWFGPNGETKAEAKAVEQAIADTKAVMMQPKPDPEVVQQSLKDLRTKNDDYQRKKIDPQEMLEKEQRESEELLRDAQTPKVPEREEEPSADEDSSIEVVEVVDVEDEDWSLENEFEKEDDTGSKGKSTDESQKEEKKTEADRLKDEETKTDENTAEKFEKSESKDGETEPDRDVAKQSEESKSKEEETENEIEAAKKPGEGKP